MACHHIANVSATKLVRSFPTALKENFAAATQISFGALSTPELVDLLIWNVIIALLVNISATSIYDGIKAALNRQGKLTAKDISHFHDVLDIEIEVKLVKDEAIINQQITSLMRASGFNAEVSVALADEVFAQWDLLFE